MLQGSSATQERTTGRPTAQTKGRLTAAVQGPGIQAAVWQSWDIGEALGSVIP